MSVTLLVPYHLLRAWLLSLVFNGFNYGPYLALLVVEVVGYEIASMQRRRLMAGGMDEVDANNKTSTLGTVLSFVVPVILIVLWMNVK